MVGFALGLLLGVAVGWVLGFCHVYRRMRRLGLRLDKASKDLDQSIQENQDA